MYGGQDMNQMPNGLLDPNAQQQSYAAPPSMMTPIQPQPSFGMNAGPGAAPPPMHFQPQAVPNQSNNIQQQQYQFQQPQQPFQPQGMPPMHPQQQQQQQPPKPQTPEPPKPKAPLPEEYVYMQTVFNELKLQCSNAAANPVRCLAFHFFLAISNCIYEIFSSKQSVSWKMWLSVWNTFMIYSAKIA